uniref:Uncharacterized protein n=1 Tax=Strongyloides papillosus TaxID=174720 RepID=A0A0N5C5T7_STREA
MFKFIVSEPKQCENSTHPKESNVLLRGTLKCPSCKNYGYSIDFGYVLVGLDEQGVVEHIPEKCNTTFYINKFLQTPRPEDYQADFSFYCGSRPIKSIRNQNPRFLGPIKSLVTIYRVIDRSVYQAVYIRRLALVSHSFGEVISQFGIVS